jgi:hypothetical protein
LLTLSPLAPFFAAIAVANMSLLIAHLRASGWLDSMYAVIAEDQDKIVGVIGQLEFRIFSLASSNLPIGEVEVEWKALHDEKARAEGIRSLLTGIGTRVSVLTRLETLQVLAYVFMAITSFASMLLTGPNGDTIAYLVLLTFVVMLCSSIYDWIEKRRITKGMNTAHRSHWFKK